MIGLIRAFKAASLQTKIFWVVALGVGILTAALCLYPYAWLPVHRSGKMYVEHD